MAAAVTLLAACASIGRPEGGERDMLPPVYVRSTPAPGTLNFDGNRLNIYFDENIKIEDAMNKVVVSPVMKQPPMVVANGRRLSVEFRDTLVKDATYTVDFSDAIRDLNEGNILDGFAIDFSTGSTRDSLVISGMLFEARNLEPAQGMIVGVYSNLSDTAISTLPFERIAKTNQYGQFVIRNLAPGTYNLYAVNDMNRDYHWDRSEDVAFLGTTVSPAVEDIIVTDTLRATNGMDSIVHRAGSRYLPNDILLTWFNQNYKSQYMRNNSRIDSTRVALEFGAPSDTLPVVKLLNTPSAGLYLHDISRVEHSAARDSVTYWITDRDVIHADTLMLEATYLRTDSLDQLSWTTDTLKLTNRERAKFVKDLEKRDKERRKIREKMQKEGRDTVFSDTPAPLSFDLLTRGTQELNRPLYFNSSQPVDTIYSDRVHLQLRVDTVWRDLGAQHIYNDSANKLLRFTLDHKWRQGERYKLTLDSAAIVGIYGNANKASESEFTVKKEEDYSIITFNVSGIPAGETMVMELLNTQDKPVATAKVTDGRATFTFVAPNTYYARGYIDRNKNGQWDTGSLTDSIQPEDVYYYPKKLSLKKNWDINQSWDINEMPVELQKPNEIKKNKPKTKDNSGQHNDEDEEDEDDDFFMHGGNNWNSRGRSGGGTAVQGGMPDRARTSLR